MVLVLAIVFFVLIAPFSKGVGAQTVADVEQKISDAKFKMTAACAIAWQSQSYEEIFDTRRVLQRLRLRARDLGGRGWWVRGQRPIYPRFDERAAIKRARVNYDNIAAFSIPEGVQIPAAAHGFIANCRDKLEKSHRQFWQLELLHARKREEEMYQSTLEPSVQQPAKHSRVTNIEITTYETHRKSPYEVSDIPCITCPE